MDFWWVLLAFLTVSGVWIAFWTDGGELPPESEFLYWFDAFSLY